MEDCAFCEIIKSTREAAQVYIDDDHVAFMDRFPINPGHLLVVPKKHYSTLMKMSPEEVAELFKVVLKLSKAVLGATHANGLNIGQNNGRPPVNSCHTFTFTSSLGIKMTLQTVIGPLVDHLSFWNSRELLHP